ncbi:hypothetical protein M5X11_10885 [Paenibacillus alginolyticus]|uniref:hypothetical protein n=1 Tax=Paenibacillus alginolyticus TaxID=59839 RepID=UPI000417AC14|nr:hypothetical protein [Paenibacillus alginolyticus]MCY9665462.1 hypothetical protein [Paenibacillus alginolyticus]
MANLIAASPTALSRGGVENTTALDEITAMLLLKEIQEVNVKKDPILVYTRK